MRVCLVCGSWPPVRCGVGDYAHCLARALAGRAGGQVEVVVLPPQRSWRGWAAGGAARRILGLRPDIVHLQYPSAGYGRGLAPNLLFGWLRLLGSAARCVLTVHEYQQYTLLGKLRLWPALALAQAVICTNHADRRAVRAFQPRVRNRLRVIPLGSSVGHDLQARSGLKTGRGRRFWLAHFGTVMPNKGWEILLPALSLLAAEKVPVGLKVAGSLDPGRYAYHAQVAQEIKSRGLEGRVVFSGYLPPPDVGRVLRESCGLAVQPYTRGASLNRSSLVAVLAHGLAVMTTRPGRPLEHLRHGQEYWCVEPTPAALAQGIKDLLSAPSLVARLQAGARRAARRFAWSKIAGATLKVYNNRRGDS